MEGFRALLKLRRTLLLSPKKLLSFSSAFSAVGDQGRADFTKGPRAAWLGCLCSPIAPNHLGRLSAAPRVPSALLPPACGREPLQQPTQRTRTRRGQREQ